MQTKVLQTLASITKTQRVIFHFILSLIKGTSSFPHSSAAIQSAVLQHQPVQQKYLRAEVWGGRVVIANKMLIQWLWN